MKIAHLIQSIKDLLADSFPELAESLRPAAAEERIREAEQLMGITFPRELRELYRIHNGQEFKGALFFGMPFLPLKEVVQQWQVWADIAEQTDYSDDIQVFSAIPGMIQERYANPNYIPISHDGGGNHIGIDMNPGAKGVVGQVISYGRDDDTRYVIALGIAEFLAFIIHHLNQGNYDIKSYNFRYSRELVLKEPPNTHFLDTLKHLNLPYGTEAVPRKKYQQKLAFEDWFFSLSKAWQEEIMKHATIEGDFVDLEHVTSLWMMSSAISDLSPILAFPNVRKLILTDTAVSDLSPMRSLKHLKILYLAKNRIQDGSPLIELPHLESLNLSQADISKTISLSQLTQLTILDVSSANLPSLSWIKPLTKLKRLNVSFNQFTDQELLGEFEELEFLDICHTPVTSLEFVGHLQQLKEIRLSGAPLADYRPLTHLPHLRSITATFEQFMILSHLFDRWLSFSIQGNMTEQQEEMYRGYMSRE